jgi:hypothetical protein
VSRSRRKVCEDLERRLNVGGACCTRRVLGGNAAEDDGESHAGQKLVIRYLIVISKLVVVVRIVAKIIRTRPPSKYFK